MSMHALSTNRSREKCALGLGVRFQCQPDCAMYIIGDSTASTDKLFLSSIVNFLFLNSVTPLSEVSLIGWRSAEKDPCYRR